MVLKAGATCTRLIEGEFSCNSDLRFRGVSNSGLDCMLVLVREEDEGCVGKAPGLSPRIWGNVCKDDDAILFIKEGDCDGTCEACVLR